MVVKYISLLKKKTEMLCTKTNYVLPYSGEIVIEGIKDRIIYINGEAIEVEKGKKVVTVRDKSIRIEGDKQGFDIRVLCSEMPQETTLDYVLFGKAFGNNLVDGVMDSEILFTAIEEEENDEIKLTLCTFNRTFKRIKEKRDLDSILTFVEKLPHIFYKPKLHLNQVNEIRPASVVSRIGQESISHLASHSEHWKGIKASGLVPERLLARVLEDDYAIYENLVVKTLVDRLYEREKKDQEEGLDCELQTHIDEGHSVSSEQKSYYHAVNILMKGMDEEDEAFLHEILGDQREKVDKILDLLSRCKSTPLYRALKRNKTVKGKLKKTNIFMMDNYYKYAYKLWNIIDNTNEVSAIRNLDDILDEYSIYCKVLFLFSLRYFNFKPVNEYCDVFKGGKFANSKYAFNNWSLHLENIEVKELQTNGFLLTMTISKEIRVDMQGMLMPDEKDLQKFAYVKAEGNELVFSRSILEQEQSDFVSGIKSAIPKAKQNKWSLDLKQKLYATFYNYKEDQRRVLFVPWKYRLVDNIEEIKTTLERMEEAVSQYDFDECYIMTIGRPNDYSNVKDVGVLNNLLYYGDANEIKSVKKGKVGVVPIGMNDMNSYRRFTKIILRQMICLDKQHKNCPICSTLMRYPTEGYAYCNNCNYQIIETQCSSCGEKFLFTRYDLPKTNGIDTDVAGLKVLFHENSLGYKNITDAIIQGGQLDPVCPCCGK